MKAPMDFQKARNVRRTSKSLVGKFRAGKLNPVMCVPVKGNEAGMISQSVTIELDPIAGRLITPITGELIAVFVPTQAIDAIRDPAAQYAGMTEVVREKLLSGNPLFGLETENEISQRCGVTPRSLSGVKRVNLAVRYGHNAAVNFLRQRKYHKATLLSGANQQITPAILMETVLDKLNGVLDPDDRVNGAVNLDLASIKLPVHWTEIGAAHNSSGGALNTTHQTIITPFANRVDVGSGLGRYSAPDRVYADLNGASAGSVSLSDFYNAELMDKRVRQMQQIVQENPEYGEEMVLRWVHGLSIDPGKTPILLAEKRQIFGRDIAAATDSAGVANDVMRSDMAIRLQMTVAVPKTELGGLIFTFLVVRPDETFQNQPDPILSDHWGVDNFIADEMALDPVRVLMRELDSEVALANETAVALYTGLNALHAAYVTYGLTRNMNPAEVDNKNALWQIKLPMSVTPDNILYPADLDHYPFADQQAQVCRYNIVSQATMPTPMIMGPSPVETLAVINSENLFEES